MLPAMLAKIIETLMPTAMKLITTTAISSQIGASPRPRATLWTMTVRPMMYTVALRNVHAQWNGRTTPSRAFASRNRPRERTLRR